VSQLLAGGTAVQLDRFTTHSGATGTIDGSQNVVVSGNQGKDTYVLVAKVPANISIRYFRLEAIADSSLPENGPGRSSDGNFVVTEFSVSYQLPGGETTNRVPFKSVQADHEQQGFAVAAAIDGKPDTGWGILPFAGENHVAVFEVASETEIPANAELTISIEQRHSDKHTLGKFRLSVAAEIASSSRDGEQQRQELVAARDRWQREMPPPIPLAMAMQEGGTPGGLFPNIQDVPIHIRGSYTKLGSVVARRVPRPIAGNFEVPILRGSGRFELASWVASPYNPLTPRVLVNRLWHWHFGDGIVRTPNNFGKLGAAPTHPELLDWLASEFVADHDWSLKRAHRRILLSATYQQSSRRSPDAVERDPENRWLTRYSPRRLEAESLRDAILQASGELDRTFGGPAGDDFTISRRSLYVQTARWDRSSYANLFDAANPDSSTERRTVSTVAPQSLLLLNHEFLRSRTSRLATNLFDSSGATKNQQIRAVFRAILGRAPTDKEAEIARRLLDGASPSDSQSRSGLIDLVHVLFCSNEFCFVD